MRIGSERQCEQLNLKAGEWVEVRNQDEILATLDESGRLDKLPFMPEMLQYCGKTFRVFKRADKTCDYLQSWSIRRMRSTVHLEGVRCDGEGHSGCQASCLVFWKEAWLKRVKESGPEVADRTRRSDRAAEPALCTVDSILRASCRTTADGETVFSCQATEVTQFSSYMRMWDPRQYVRDLRSGNLATGLADGTRAHRALDLLLGVIQVLRVFVISIFNEVQNRRHGLPYPFIEGLADKSPMEHLNLQPGELVEVKSKEEIMATLDKSQRNRGLWFDSEMLPYCGNIYRVLRRVNRIVEERTGRLITLKNPCIILEGVVCRSEFHRLCPRAIYPYWRESWLRRARDRARCSAEQGRVLTCGRENEENSVR